MGFAESPNPEADAVLGRYLWYAVQNSEKDIRPA